MRAPWRRGSRSGPAGQPADAGERTFGTRSSWRPGGAAGPPLESIFGKPEVRNRAELISWMTEGLPTGGDGWYIARSRPDAPINGG